jgi:hypothetical protein
LAQKKGGHQKWGTESVVINEEGKEEISTFLEDDNLNLVK